MIWHDVGCHSNNHFDISLHGSTMVQLHSGKDERIDTHWIQGKDVNAFDKRAMQIVDGCIDLPGERRTRH